MEENIKRLLSGIIWGESPRWRGEKLWFSDIFGKKVMNVGLDGKPELVADIPMIPSGLGWLPDGSILIAAGNGKILSLKNDILVEIADFSEHASGINDLVVDQKGRAYVGCYGYDVRTYKPGEQVDAWISLVDAYGNIKRVADGLICPNGMVISESGRNLIVADTFAKQLIAFEIQEDGCLANRRIWAETPEGPDGITMDRKGGVWAAIPNNGEVIRILEGGEVTRRIKLQATPLACTLGGIDGKRLFIITVGRHNGLDEETLSNQEDAQKRKESCIEYIDVEIAGVGSP